MRTNIYGLTLEQLEELMVQENQNKYRAKQLFSWIYEKNVTDFDLMSDISKKFIAILKEKYCLIKPTIFTKQVSSDGTIKLLLEMEDGAKVETVLMRYNYGQVACVSSQVGCNMGCSFCASGLLKRQRNLTTSEMVGEILALNDLIKEENLRVTHVVVMGTGEPFDNFDNVMNFIKIINNQKALAIGARHITVSTCGIPDKIRMYASSGLQINLAISLHAPNDELRFKLMPINKAYPLHELMEAIKYYNVTADRRITFEYILLKDVNDTMECADELASLIRPVFAYVNLIPYNEVNENGYHRFTRAKEFMDRLMKKGVNVTIRKEFGTDIDAACGQLRAKKEKIL
ncbi:MAG: 23S rRNA (adenine(2503)-C(2))-methyltransferase RlmN [Bacilli bacterium]